MTLTGNFHEFSAEIRFFLIWSQIQVPKTGRFKKKIHQNNRSRTDFIVDFLNFFWKKKSKIFKKNFFESCYFIFEHGEKKKFFFEKNFGPDFDQNFDFYFSKSIVFFQKKIFLKLFFSLFSPQRTVLD